MNEKIITILVWSETVFIVCTLAIGLATYNEVRRDPLDVNRDGVANIIDLSVLASQLNARGQY